MNKQSEALLGAVDILVENALTKLQLDKTVQAEVYNIVNPELGEYQVRYQGNIFSAFSDKSYRIGDMVYTLIPEGNLSNKKLILDKISSQSLSYEEMNNLYNNIIPLEPTLDVMVGFEPTKLDGGNYGVIAGAPQGTTSSELFIYRDAKENDLFRQYAREYERIKITADFKTQFYSTHSKGNYGLEIGFRTIAQENEEPVIASYKLDLADFNGDPYQLNVFTTQGVVLTTQSGFLDRLEYIRLFQEGFEYDELFKDGLPSGEYNTTKPNIFVKNIKIAFAKEVNYENIYYLDIATPQGTKLMNDVRSLDLVARLSYGQRDILSEDSCEVYWYKQDLTVAQGDEDYSMLAGARWVEIPSTTFGILTLSAEDVIHEETYKLIVKYKDGTPLSETVTVSNATSAYNLALAQETVGDKIWLQLVNKSTDQSLTADWFMSYPNGSYTQLLEGETAIDITKYLIYDVVMFYCRVYSPSDPQVAIVQLMHSVVNSDSQDDIIINYDGLDTYHYDANGDVSIAEAELGRTLKVALQWKEGTGISYNLYWLMDDSEIPGNVAAALNPNQSMIEDLWVDNNNILHYTIRQKYNVSYNNNTITIKIVTVDGKEYLFKKELLFLKDGDQGTNGTTFVAAIRPYDTESADEKKLSGLQPIIYWNGEWQNTLPLKCYIYKDGEEITNLDNITIKWSANGVNLINQNGNINVASGYALPTSPAAGYYVKAQVIIPDARNGKTYNIYCSYPIDILVGELTDTARIQIEDFPSYIKYTSSGVNPQFYSSPYTYIVDGEDRSSSIVSITPEIMDVIRKFDGKYYLEPASVFINDQDTMAIIECPIDDAKRLLHTVMLYLDQYGNEAINGWDGGELVIDEENGKYIYAPQIGAGEKDSANRFTGVVMGSFKDTMDEPPLVGLYGYQSGVATFGLQENGVAFFGPSTGGGRVYIDGNEAKIYGGLSENAANSMVLTLAQQDLTKDTKAISLKGDNGEETFYLKYSGDAYLSGTIEATTGSLGGKEGWTIEAYRLFSNKNGKGHIELNSDPSEDYAFWVGATTGSAAASSKLAITKTGKLYANEGEIAGWTIDNKALFKDRVGLSSNGQYAIWAGAAEASWTDENGEAKEAPFWVKRDGSIKATNATIEGKITAGAGSEIGGFTISANALFSPSTNTTYNTGTGVYIGTDGINIKNGFKVNSEGVMKATNGEFSGDISGSYGQFTYLYAGRQAGEHVVVIDATKTFNSGLINIGFVPNSSGWTYNDVSIYPGQNTGTGTGVGNIGLSDHRWDKVFCTDLRCSTINGTAIGDLTGLAKFG